MLAVVLATGFALDATLPSYVTAAVVNPMGGVIGVAAVGGLKRSRHPGAFNLLAAGVVTYSIADVVGLLAASRGMELVAFGLFLVAYIAMSTGLASFFARRWRHNTIRRRHHRGA